MTITEIAKLAGVSNAAVSRYLNDGYLSQEKREIIRKVIEETGYKPSAQAQNLRTKKTKIIGVIIPKIDSSAIGRVVKGIQTVLEKKGYQILLANTQNDIEKEIKYLELFDDGRVDGIIFSATSITARHKKIIKACPVPVVIVGQYIPGYNCVFHDDYNAVKELTELMLSHDRKNIGYIGVLMSDEAAGKNRYNGYCDALKAAGLEELTQDYVISDFTIASGYDNAQKLIERKPDIDGIVCATDNIAAGTIQYLKKIGKSIPEEVSVMGIGNTKVSKIMEPSFPTIKYFYEESGQKAAEILMDILKSGQNSVGAIKMGYEIVENKM